MALVEALLLVGAGYLIGSLPFGYWIPRWLRGVDIRTVGSGNTGATNVWRTFGFKLGLTVAALDIAKGAAAVLLARWLADDLVAIFAGVAAMVGHYRPLFLWFSRGGKAVATLGGVGLALAPLATLSAAVVWVAVFLVFRYASLASLVAAVDAAPLRGALRRLGPGDRLHLRRGRRRRPAPPGNIRRLRSGTEHKIALRRRAVAGA